MPDIAPSFDDVPSKDGGAMPEVWFDDLIPPKRPPPSLFETMWHQAVASVSRSPLAASALPRGPIAQSEMQRQTPSESLTKSIEAQLDTPLPQRQGASAPALFDSTDGAPIPPQQPDASDQAQHTPDVQLNDEAARDRLAGQAMPSSSLGEVGFHDLIPKPGPPVWAPVQSESVGSDASGAEAARAVAALRLSHSTIHGKEGAATDLIPELALTLLTFAAPYVVAPLAGLMPQAGRIVANVLPKIGRIPASEAATVGEAASTAELESLTSRVHEIHKTLHPIAQKNRVTAALSTNAETIVAGGIRDLDPVQRTLLRPGEMAVKLRGAHAEITALSGAQKAGLVPRALATTRPICSACAGEIESAGGRLTSETTAIFPN
jgi:hypothetical protein